MTLKKLIHILLVIVFFQVLFFCKKDEANKNVNVELNNDFYLGADLSYVNEMEDCGAIYKNLNNLYQLGEILRHRQELFHLLHNQSLHSNILYPYIDVRCV